MLLEKAQDVVFKEQASLFGVKCYKRRDSDLPSDSLDVLSNWSRNSDELMRYSTYSRLVFGGIFGFRPSGLLALSIPSVFGPQDDVARSMAHYLQDGVVVLFDKYCAVKTMNEAGGNVDLCGSRGKRDQRNARLRTMMLSWAEDQASSSVKRKRLDDIMAWWRRSKFLRRHIKRRPKLKR